MTQRNVDFRELKHKVGVDDLAYHLGYRLDRTAGVGRFIEMSLPDNNGGSRDTIVISHPNEKENQTFFHRTTGRGGDAISFIRENVHNFGVAGKNDWDVVTKVMCKFANEPIPDYGNSAYLVKAGYTGTQQFDQSRYQMNPFSGTNRIIMAEMNRRNISNDTLHTFAPALVEIKDTHNTRFNGFSLGFPYREPGKDKIVGAEIRGYNGFKSKAAGTNSNTAAWVVDLSLNKDPDSKKNVYFAESGLDIMAFYQANRLKIDKESAVFVSTGGTFSEKQITGIMKHYSNARGVDCFDNDLAGRIYGIKMAALMEKIPVEIVKNGNSVEISSGNKKISLSDDKVSLSEFRKHFPVHYEIGQWKAPANFKDWNDVVMGKPLKEVARPTLFQRNERLEQSRMKL